MNWIAGYTHWLHTMWPARTVEKLPEVREDGTTAGGEMGSTVHFVYFANSGSEPQTDGLADEVLG